MRLRLRKLSLHDERGISLIIALLATLIVSTVLASAFTAAITEINLSSKVTDQKKAYYAAQAGISWFLFHLNQNAAFLTYCTEPPGFGVEHSTGNPLNQLYKSSTGGEERKASELTKVSVPGMSAGEEEFALQLIPEQSAPSNDRQCDPNKISETMIEKTGRYKGDFRIKVTGFSGKEKRSLIVTFRSEGFLDFIYYTVFETEDPQTYPSLWASTHSVAEAEKYCEKKYSERASWCVNIYFGTGDSVNGPMHTQDHVGVLGSPIFGKETGDAIEFGTDVNDGCGHPDKGYSEEAEGNGCGSPTFKGELVPHESIKPIEPPPSDKELEKWDSAENGGLTFSGPTELILESSKIRAKKPGTEEEGTVYAWPSDDVIYVTNNGNCSEVYHQYRAFYPSESTCGDAYVRGTYSRSLTIGSANNIIIDGNLLASPDNAEYFPTGNAELGLIAEKFVRVYHPVLRYSSCARSSGSTCTSCSSGSTLTSGKCEYENQATKCTAPSLTSSNVSTLNPNPLPGTSGTMENPVIDAGILALNNSFTVDNEQCPENGSYLGTLTVIGGIAQKFRGIVALVGGPGYLKNYQYDYRLQAGEPPHFLNPVQAAWKIIREVLAPAPL